MAAVREGDRGIFFVPQLVQEFDSHEFTVSIDGLVERGPPAAPGRGLDRRARPNWPRPAGMAPRPYRKCPSAPRSIGAARVHRGKAQRAAQLLAVDHVPADMERVAQRARALQVADRQCSADFGLEMRWPCWSVTSARVCTSRSRAAGSASRQQVDVAAALCASGSPRPPAASASAEALDQQVLDEGVGRHFGQAGGEALHHHLGNAIAGPARPAFAQAGDAGGRQFEPAVQGGKVLPCGSKVITAGVGRVRARTWQTRASMAWCPRWTVEIADGQGAGRALSEARRGSVDAQRRFHGRVYNFGFRISPHPAHSCARGGPVPNPAAPG